MMAAFALIAVQLLIRGTVAARGYFYWDDLILVARSGDHPLLSAEFLLYDHDGHLMPGAFLVAGILTRIAPLDWALPAISLVVLQALASLAVLRVLRVILGSRPTMLIPLALYLFSPLTLPSFAWWANGLNQLPLQAGLALVTAEAILLYRTGRVRHAVTGAAALVIALAFYEKSVVIPFVAFVAVALLAHTSGIRRPLRSTARACAPLWASALVILAAWAAVYFSHVASPLRTDNIDDAAGLLQHGTSLGLLPALFGGPWSWDRWPPSPPWATPPVVLVVVSWLLIVAVIVGNHLRRRRIGWVWPSVAAYALASQLAMVTTRGGDATAVEIAQTLRYVADTAVVVAIALAIIDQAPRRATHPAFRPFLSVRSRPAFTALAAVAFLAGSLWSTFTFDQRWRDNPTVDYVTTAKAELAANRDVPLLSQPVSIWVLLPVAAPYNQSSQVFGPLRDRPAFSDSTPALRMLDDDGHLVPAEVSWVRALTEGMAPGCGTRVTGDAVAVAPGVDGAIALSQPVIPWVWTAQLNYLSNRDGTIEVSMSGGPPVTVPVHSGLGTAYVRLTGGGATVDVSAVTPDLNLCFGGGPFGSVVPAQSSDAGSRAAAGDDGALPNP
ncbi:hypothetical protein [Tomitella fengzijianii]|uniref:Transmembrane protein n=1 Tax=Tomitella fengzijianii TaxID=2597660 RepID=A0A516X7E4_9ACTN|nr:hypothetical protein [Tomitella fengzijianii]QDQ98986.1 hypothetical protein FO059_03135 [Tomitella fengzijianii]